MSLLSSSSSGFLAPADTFPLQRLRSDFLALRVSVKLRRLSLMLRAYHPDQPRAPAGTPEGGQWIEDGRIRVAQAGRGSFRVSARFPDASPGQQARLVASTAQASVAVARALRVDPTWRPSDGISSNTIEGAIARNEFLAREANARLTQHYQGRVPVQSLRDQILPAGNELGVRNRGAGSDIRTINRDAFRSLLGRMLDQAQITSSPRGFEGICYLRPDGNVVGIRVSDAFGPTIVIIRSRVDGIDNGFKVHYK